MSQQSRRRPVLASLGATVVAGLSGCVGSVGEQIGTEDDSEEPTETPTEEPTETPEPEPDESIHSGESIPTYPYTDTGTEPLNPRPDDAADNPVLTADDIDDYDASFVADPTLYIEDDEWHMFFEVSADGRGRIAHAVSDDAGESWEYDQVVLNLRHHVSGPYVFKWDGEYYMTTQANPRTRPVMLFKANVFPHDWYRAAELYDPDQYDHGVTDHALFRWDDTWWNIAGDERRHTYLYYSEELEASDWQPHEENPVVEDRPAASRPGGRPIVRDDDVLAFFQSQVGGFGMEVNAYRITELTPSAYADTEHPASPILTGTETLDQHDEPTWNSYRMHRYDPWYLGDGEGWRAVVDGDDGNDDWKIGVYHVRE